jgi:hypothetical protein
VKIHGVGGVLSSRQQRRRQPRLEAGSPATAPLPLIRVAAAGAKAFAVVRKNAAAVKNLIGRLDCDGRRRDPRIS